MTKFKVGDRVRRVTQIVGGDCSNTTADKEVVTVTQRSGSNLHVVDDAGNSCWHDMSDFELEVHDMDHLWVGDILVRDDSDFEKVVEGFVGRAVVTIDSDDAVTDIHSPTSLKETGWDLKNVEPEVKEMTVADVEKLVGSKVKIVKETK
jgi:hypothetical protein